MRISTSWIQQQSVNVMLDQQASLARTQLQISSNKRILAPADDPIGSARAIDLTSFSNANAQYRRNIDFANGRLAMGEQSLASASDVLARARDLTLQAANATQTDSTRADIALELRQILQQLVQIANGKDGNGDYLFAGTATATQPFAQGVAGVTYSGNQGTRSIEIAPGQTVSTNDSGSTVFQQIPTGNGYFQIAANPANSGAIVAGANQLTDIGAWDRGSYQIRFTSATSYEIVDSASSVVSSGIYDPEGTTIAFRGTQIAFSGAAVSGDSYDLTPSKGGDVFATISAIAQALETPALTAHDRAALKDSLNRGLENIDQASARLLSIRSDVGTRMNLLDQQASVNEALNVQVMATLSGIQDLDYAGAIAKLNQQTVGLQAAQQAYVRVQGLSLFNYLK